MDTANPSGTFNLGSYFTCDQDQGGITTTNAGSGGATITPSLGTPESAKTVAYVLKHSGTGSGVSREVYVAQGYIINSEPFPKARVEVYNGGTLRCRQVFDNIYRSTEFVMVVVTVSGTELILYKNGVSQGTRSCSYQVGPNGDSVGNLHIGYNNFGGVFKSFAYWDRTLTANEISALQTTRMGCA